MLAAAGQSLIVGTLLLVSGPPMPDRSIDKMCTSSTIVASGNNAAASCKSDERAARAALVKEWDGIPARYRSTCLDSIDSVAPSFVGLKSCIDNNMEVGKPQ